eukprot:CAMPEP_0171633038 /NCGR_PEP_ID=MMETSP0990-20121206/24903_1 /TAXON_ID=483369 /ORGANISM="non described non described, Strain CCMP2098" /LENGTH=87 /DNA_ID=CAMNT_0012203555 /DNA_START=490 /DNA_END=753 /DNA_ORIENTATION=+
MTPEGNKLSEGFFLIQDSETGTTIVECAFKEWDKQTAICAQVTDAAVSEVHFSKDCLTRWSVAYRTAADLDFAGVPHVSRGKWEKNL